VISLSQQPGAPSPDAQNSCFGVYSLLLPVFFGAFYKPVAKALGSLTMPARYFTFATLTGATRLANLRPSRFFSSYRRILTKKKPLFLNFFPTTLMLANSRIFTERESTCDALAQNPSLPAKEKHWLEKRSKRPYVSTSAKWASPDFQAKKTP